MECKWVHTLYKKYLECFSFLAGIIGFKNTTQENQRKFFCYLGEKKTLSVLDHIIVEFLTLASETKSLKIKRIKLLY